MKGGAVIAIVEGATRSRHTIVRFADGLFRV